MGFFTRLFGGGGRNDDASQDAEPAGPPSSWVSATGPRRPWIIGCQATGAVIFEAGEKEIILAVLPVADRAVFKDIDKLSLMAKVMKVRRVIVCNAGDDGHLAGTAIDKGDYATAEPLLRRAATWDPENLEIAADLGFTLSKLDRDDEAMGVYDAAIARGGTRHLLRFNRGNCQLRRQHYDEAAADFRACVDLKADWHEARVNLVSALYAKGDKKAARTEIDQLKKLGGPPQFVRSLEQMVAGTL